MQNAGRENDNLTETGVKKTDWLYSLFPKKLYLKKKKTADE